VPEVGVKPAVQERINSGRADRERLEQQVDELEVRSADRLVEELGQQRVDVPRRPADDEHDHDAGQDARCYMSTMSQLLLLIPDHGTSDPRKPMGNRFADPLTHNAPTYQISAKSSNPWLSYSDLNIENLGANRHLRLIEVDFKNSITSSVPWCTNELFVNMSFNCVFER